MRKNSTERAREFKQRLNLVSIPALPAQFRDRLKIVAERKNQSIRQLLTDRLGEFIKKLEEEPQ